MSMDVVLQAARDCREAGRDWARWMREDLHPSEKDMIDAPPWPVGTMLDEAERRVPKRTYGFWNADEIAMLAREIDRAAAERWEELRREAERFLYD